MFGKLKGYFAMLVLLVLMGIVGGMDYEDAQRDAEQYCNNVQSGVWPDYNGTFDRDCRATQK